MNTHESYVSLETARLLKEAGFDWECSHWLSNDGSLWITDRETNNLSPENKKRFIHCPSLDVAQRWLREVKYCYLDVMVESDVDDDGNITFDGFTAYYVFIGKPHGLADSDGVIYGNFDTYESALEVGIKKALEIILKKGE